MIAFYPTPDLFDLDGWKRHLEWLRSEREEIVARTEAIEFAELTIRLLENPTSPQRPAEAA
ncbi:hypothetical protein LO749_06485 [Paracoccus denitrificans]|uniref:hypothetical protein n=1 Tax=Paracoccus denitrificans TaxID=266 RepID=UPI001E653183|nr:hypothetical protein [Paracoccus denitrificans]UFS63834.1 hypothetical protein LO749_06485 [Paracoccus denitrificans]